MILVRPTRFSGVCELFTKLQGDTSLFQAEEWGPRCAASAKFQLKGKMLGLAGCLGVSSLRLDPQNGVLP